MSAQYALEVTNIAHAYNGIPVLGGVTFNVPAGEVTGVLGRSGCGKTTLLKIVAGLLQPNNGGRIRIDGHDASDVPTHKRNIGFVFQDLALFPHLTVRQNVEFPFRHGSKNNAGVRHATVAINTILERTGLMAYASMGISQLSGGMRQRVALARALVYRPAIILLDEPLTSLDNPRKAEILDLLHEIKTGLEHTFLYVTHDDREIKAFADNVVVLDTGVVVRAGTLEEVIADPRADVARELLNARYGTIGAKI
ncbi:MAG: spermidine/putrescine transport system ATP-binding protein [Thermoanaerobaculia bacterium]|jgi:ABC-type Fe3+/spermidine/putrescine transport system ATPase subunit|nr:spermidine/putrescine transport system ATP-binding protein [Thermoanaerobaculia bacterium]